MGTNGGKNSSQGIGSSPVTPSISGRQNPILEGSSDQILVTKPRMDRSLATLEVAQWQLQKSLWNGRVIERERDS